MIAEDAFDVEKLRLKYYSVELTPTDAIPEPARAVLKQFLKKPQILINIPTENLQQSMEAAGFDCKIVPLDAQTIYKRVVNLLKDDGM